ncbi:MAG: metal ABC transporter substrate-binding protein [Anaerolineae bacterium]|nr:metal ABC transporter substrate-binding protein [Anaerolineae bacterium]
MGKSLALLGMVLGIVLLLVAGGCRPGPAHEADQEHEADEMPQLRPADLKAGEKLRVVATTNIVADVVHQVGGDLIELTTLLPAGTDPHTFEPTPQDAAALAGAHVVFANGAGLELFLEDLLESVGGEVALVPVSYGVELLTLEEEGEAEAHPHHGEVDPHVWFDPNHVVVWVSNIEQVLGALDPAHAAAYQANAERYRAELRALDSWIEEMVAQVPVENRKLVVDHKALAYFARRYGFEQVGAVFPGYSTLTEPSARELAALEEVIREHGVRAIFVSTTVNPALAERVARDTGTRLVFLYTGSLSEPGGPADNYIALMRYNTAAIVSALR